MKAKALLILFLLSISFQSLNAQTVIKPTVPNEACMEAWNSYRKANTLWYTGWGLFSVGLVATTAGAMTWTLSWVKMPRDQWSASQLAVNNSGMALMCIGSGMFIASIPCMAIGQARRKKAMNAYHEWGCSPETCDDFRINYQKADKLWKAGWGLLGAGAGLALVGGLMVGCSNPYIVGKEANKYMPVYDSGWGLFAVGCGALLSSVPCLAIGQVRRKASRNLLDTKCTDQPPLTFSINSSSNGLGLAISF